MLGSSISGKLVRMPPIFTSLIDVNPPGDKVNGSKVESPPVVVVIS
jgi:hypothetical protein